MESWNPSGTRVGPMSPSEVKNLFFRLMSSRSNGGGGRQEGSAASEGEPSPRRRRQPRLPSVLIPHYRHGSSARGAAAHAGLTGLAVPTIP